MTTHKSVEKSSTESVFSKNHYIEYQPGTLNVILSVPHGGSMRPRSIPNREDGDVDDLLLPVDQCSRGSKVRIKTKCDLYTVELALMLAEALQRHTGRRPHVIINHLHRQKLDCNCDQPEATLGVPEAIVAWNTYHNFIETAKQSIGGSGLFIDIHGHNHPEGWVELGYTISREELNSQQFSSANTSVRELFRRLNAKKQLTDIRQLIYGPLSLGGLIEAVAGFSIVTVPSPQQSSPGKCLYFAGGYNVKRHGSRFGGLIDAIQIESPLELRLPEAGANYAEMLGQALASFVRHFYD
jgi:hypothetical protein